MSVHADEPEKQTIARAASGKLFAPDNLIAWCIVPFDSKRRGPEERAAMLEKLGFKHFAYDYRAEHVPTFDAEIEACKRHGVSLDAWWFPGGLNAEARLILDVCKRHNIRPQLWVTGGGTPTSTPEEFKARVEQEVKRIRPIAEAAAAQGMKVGLYNHGGWFGEPENQLAIIEALKLDNVGIVYNFHHGHDHVDRIADVFKKARPHLLAVNLNGMARGGDRQGKKILPLGQGELDLELLKAIRDSGYAGPIGILGHTQDDAEERLRDNLDGLAWLLPQLDGQSPGAKPQPRTMKAAATQGKAPGSRPQPAGYLIDGRDEYRTAPLTVEMRATLRGKSGYNILVACDTKASGAHWELFTMPGSGQLTAYLPGHNPDHVRTSVDLCDGRPHDVAMVLESRRVQLYVDGKAAAEQSVESKKRPVEPGGLAIGRLVEGGIGCDGAVHALRLTRGAQTITPRTTDQSLRATADTLGLWRIEKPDTDEIADESKFKNSAKRTSAAQAAAPTPIGPGPHLKAADPRLAVTLIDRSPDQVYMAVKCDRDGHVFVGGREGVFVFERQVSGSFGPRRELLRFPTESIIMGLEFRFDNLYVLTSNCLYFVPKGRVQRTELKPERILWGIPLDLHVSFHCMAWGPSGDDLYVSHGDPLLQYGDWKRPDHWGHWTLYCGREGAPLAYTGQGAVLRMKPYGTEVTVFATGLRGPVGLTFDPHGNLFTNDNDHESRADQYAPARLLHVVDGVDFAWPRGWMASKSPDRFDLVDTMNNDLGRGVPCDLTWCADPLLGDSLRDRLLMCRWDRFAVTAYRPQPRGVSFQAAEETVVAGDANCRPVGVAVGPEGRMFVTALYMAGNTAAPYCPSDLVMISRKEGNSPLIQTSAVDSTEQAPAKPTSPLDDARSDDTYRRQLGVRALAKAASLKLLRTWSVASDEPTRMTAVLTAGRRLTVMDPHFVPPAELELFYPKESAFFKRNQAFYGVEGKLDLATLARTGSFTTAQWWAAIKHTPEQESLFELLIAALADASPRVQLQSAYYLSLLKDSRSEPLVELTRQDVQIARLGGAAEVRVEHAWSVGPFLDGDDAGLAKTHPPEQGAIDLAAGYDSPSGRKEWLESRATAGRFNVTRLKATDRASTYLYFCVQSGARQDALVKLEFAGHARLWNSGSPVNSASAGQWLVDLQPGSNDLLLRLQTPPDQRTSDAAVHLSALGKLQPTLPEKLDSALLGQRLRDAAAGGTQAIPSEFLSVEWSKAAGDGDPVEGQRLFAALACSKCHAVAPDQKAAGAPSLVDAKRRFAVAHIVESVLLPSQQIAEPFRGQTIVTDDGRSISGLVIAESAESLEVLLPDATRRVIPKREVETRVPSPVSPMPAGLVKTPQELWHLLSYLLSDRPAPP